MEFYNQVSQYKYIVRYATVRLDDDDILCERYVDMGKQRPNFGVYETRLDQWTGETEYNVNGKWMTIKEYKKT